MLFQRLILSAYSTPFAQPFASHLGFFTLFHASSGIDATNDNPAYLIITLTPTSS